MFVSCPDPACHAPAEILDRYPLGSTAGPWEHVRTYCVRRHIFVLPTERVPGSGFREPTPGGIGSGPDCPRTGSGAGISRTTLELISREVRNSKWECGA
jgi:hypothetical protein